MTHILLVDDEAAVRYTLQEIVLEEGWHPLLAKNGKEALPLLDQADLVVTDLSMPIMDGMALLQHIHQSHPDLPVIMLTARGSERSAVQALKQGAHDYLTKPFDLDELILTLRRALNTSQLRTTLRQSQAEQALGTSFIAQSPPMKRLLAQIEKLAKRPLSVLVHGETGTGKELVGSLLHELGTHKGPLIRFNCAALPPSLAESELFGHAKGAFTGATHAKEGFFERAHQGTLILDEVGELPLPVQASLLRALQSGEIQPVGAARVKHVDVRVVACTHRDLRADITAKRFREDLYYRLAVVELRVPPLRERPEDITPLIHEFIRRYTLKFDLETTTFTLELLQTLQQQPWPGNVRELENTIARILALSEGNTLGVEVLSTSFTSSTPDNAGQQPLRAQMMAFERQLILQTLTDTGNNQSEAARRLQVSRSTLIDKIKRHNL